MMYPWTTYTPMYKNIRYIQDRVKMHTHVTLKNYVNRKFALILTSTFIVYRKLVCLNRIHICIIYIYLIIFKAIKVWENIDEISGFSLKFLGLLKPIFLNNLRISIILPNIFCHVQCDEELMNYYTYIGVRGCIVLPNLQYHQYKW